MMVLLFYYKGMLEKVTMQNPEILSFCLLPKEPSEMPRMRSKSKKLRLSEKLTSLRYVYFSRTAH